MSTSRSVDEMQESVTENESPPLSFTSRFGGFIYTFVKTEDMAYMLYKIDALGFYVNRIKERHLNPLLVFKSGVLPQGQLAFAFIESFFYIIGQGQNDFYCIKKDEIEKLPPSENNEGNQFLYKIDKPMRGFKLNPLAFVYNENLYVLSTAPLSPWLIMGNSVYDLEVYSPSRGEWRHLGKRPLHDCYVKGHFVLGTMAYFTTSNNVLMSFNLKAGNWSTVFDPYGVLTPPIESSRITPRPTFDTQINAFGDIIFGAFTRSGQSSFDVCASHCFRPSHKLFLRPTLANDEKFCKDLYADWSGDLAACSKFIVKLDNDLMCIVTYGGSTSSCRDDENYAVLTFFGVSKGYHESSSNNAEDGTYDCRWNRMFSYAREGLDGPLNHFNAQYLHRVTLPIYTENHLTFGTIASCMIV